MWGFCNISTYGNSLTFLQTLCKFAEDLPCKGGGRFSCNGAKGEESFKEDRSRPDQHPETEDKKFLQECPKTQSKHFFCMSMEIMSNISDYCALLPNLSRTSDKLSCEFFFSLKSCCDLLDKSQLLFFIRWTVINITSQAFSSHANPQKIPFLYFFM